MVTRLTPNDAQEIVRASCRAEELARVTNGRQKRNASRAASVEAMAWAKQARRLLFAAVSGRNELTLEEEHLIRPDQLFNAGFTVLGSAASNEDRLDAEKLFNEAMDEREVLANNVRAAMDSWLHLICQLEPRLFSHKREIRSELNQLIKTALADPPSDDDSISSQYFDGIESCELLSSIEFEEISHRTETIALEVALRNYHSARDRADLASDSLVWMKEPTAAITGLADLEKLEAPFSIRWDLIDTTEPWNQRDLVSARGLGWISGKPGQSLLLELDHLISETAGIQRSSTEINILYSPELGHFAASQSLRPTHFPPQAEMVTILTCLGWTASATNYIDSGYRLVISW